jgi:hypothetical protein
VPAAATSDVGAGGGAAAAAVEALGAGAVCDAAGGVPPPHPATPTIVASDAGPNIHIHRVRIIRDLLGCLDGNTPEALQ